jgi:hypothetical protein
VPLRIMAAYNIPGRPYAPFLSPSPSLSLHPKPLSSDVRSDRPDRHQHSARVRASVGFSSAMLTVRRRPPLIGSWANTMLYMAEIFQASRAHVASNAHSLMLTRLAYRLPPCLPLIRAGNLSSLLALSWPSRRSAQQPHAHTYTSCVRPAASRV